MAWASLVLLAFLFAASCAAGMYVGGRAKPAALTVAALSLLAILVRVLFRFRPDLEYPLLASGLYSAIRPWWVFPFVFVSTGIGMRRMRRWPSRLGMVCAAGGLFVVGLEPSWVLATFHADDYTGCAGRDGVCLQTQDYTCGAAAAATLLGQYGVRTDEREMARLCSCAPLTGTDEIAVCCALRAKLRDAGYRVAVERPGQDGLGRYLRPVMTRMKQDPFRDHWVVLFAINDSFAVVGDPVQGRMELPASEFLANWRGTVIAAGRPPFVPYAMY